MAKKKEFYDYAVMEVLLPGGKPHSIIHRDTMLKAQRSLRKTVSEMAKANLTKSYDIRNGSRNGLVEWDVSGVKAVAMYYINTYKTTVEDWKPALVETTEEMNWDVEY